MKDKKSDALTQFRAVTPLLAEYASNHSTENHDRRHLIYEVQHRVHLAGYTLSWVSEELLQLASVQDYVKRDEALTRLELLTEAFYHSAWRACEVAKSLSGLRGFDPIGVRQVRNHLLQHPEKHERVFEYSFGLTSDSGPQVKPFRRPECTDAWHDAGLFPNAHEFAVKLRDCLKRCAESQGA